MSDLAQYLEASQFAHKRAGRDEWVYRQTLALIRERGMAPESALLAVAQHWGTRDMAGGVSDVLCVAVRKLLKGKLLAAPSLVLRKLFPVGTVAWGGMEAATLDQWRAVQPGSVVWRSECKGQRDGRVTWWVARESAEAWPGERIVEGRLERGRDDVTMLVWANGLPMVVADAVAVHATAHPTPSREAYTAFTAARDAMEADCAAGVLA